MAKTGSRKRARKKPRPEPQPEQHVRFNYIKSPQFRTILYSGIFGGLTPQGKIAMAIFNERFAIPQHVTHDLVEGSPGDEIERVGREGIVRELDVNIILDPARARSMASWLTAKAEQIDAALNQQARQKQSPAKRTSPRKRP